MALSKGSVRHQTGPLTVREQRGEPRCQLQDEDGQIADAHSISAGLNYPGIGPEHAWLHKQGRVEYVSISDDEALAAFQCRYRQEGLIPALESAYALAEVAKRAPTLPRDYLMAVNLSGRSRLPVAVGFGIRKAAQATEIGRFSDAVVVDSTLVEAIANAETRHGAIEAVYGLVRELAEGVRRAGNT